MLNRRMGIRSVTMMAVRAKTWEAHSSALFLSPAPIAFDIDTFIPSPIPAPVDGKKKYSVDTSDTADTASTPRLEHQMLSTKLFSCTTIRTTNIGTTMLCIAFFGSPRSTFTPFSGDSALLRCIVSEQSVQYYIIYSAIPEFQETWR